jgi:hypothetical protein
LSPCFRAFTYPRLELSNCPLPADSSVSVLPILSTLQTVLSAAGVPAAGQAVLSMTARAHFAQFASLSSTRAAPPVRWCGAADDADARRARNTAVSLCVSVVACFSVCCWRLYGAFCSEIYVICDYCSFLFIPFMFAYLIVTTSRYVRAGRASFQQLLDNVVGAGSMPSHSTIRRYLRAFPAVRAFMS